MVTPIERIADRRKSPRDEEIGIARLTPVELQEKDLEGIDMTRGEKRVRANLASTDGEVDASPPLNVELEKLQTYEQESQNEGERREEEGYVVGRREKVKEDRLIVTDAIELWIHWRRVIRQRGT